MTTNAFQHGVANWARSEPRAQKAQQQHHIPTKHRQSTSTISLVWLHNLLIGFCDTLRTSFLSKGAIFLGPCEVVPG